jgi:hypothetical protein
VARVLVSALPKNNQAELPKKICKQADGKNATGNQEVYQRRKA